MAEKIKISYRFNFPDGRNETFDIELASDTGLMEPSQQTLTPAAQAWTELSFNQCAHCPLKPESQPNCPIARNLAIVSERFKDDRTAEMLRVEVLTKERSYEKELRLQDALFGIFGLMMATSECPHFDFLRPMARFHLPFSTPTETTVRAVSFYLLSQYFIAKAGDKADFALNGLEALYKNLEAVNLGIVRRIRTYTKAEAQTNSIVILDGFARHLSASIEGGLKSLEKLF